MMKNILWVAHIAKINTIYQSAMMVWWVGAKPQESKDPRIMGSNPTDAIGCGHIVGDMSK